MPESTKQELLVGVDLGGTKILAGIFSPQLKLLQTAKLSTKSERGFDAVVSRIARCVRDAADEADLGLKQVRAIGIGAPGAVDPDSGEVIFAPNLRWKDAPLKKACHCQRWSSELSRKYVATTVTQLTTMARMRNTAIMKP